MPSAKRPKTAPIRTGHVENGSVHATIARLETELAAQRSLIEHQAASLAHMQKIFDQASRVAKIGVWQCTLPDEHLSWTEQVYDIFDIPPGAPLDRGRTLDLYTPASRVALHAMREQAIKERGGFSLDAEIMTAQSRRRWVRITATVECERGAPVRIFGMKQDITDEKLLADRTRYLAEFDILTGLANRASFQALLAAEQTTFGALLLVDLDEFKPINDLLGHAVGDECLRIVAARLRHVCHGADLVARIGGDEFAVLLRPGLPLCDMERMAEAIVEHLRQPMMAGDVSFRVGASVGVARTDCGSASRLFEKADTALYSAKAAGRNTFRRFIEEAEQAGRTARSTAAPSGEQSQGLGPTKDTGAANGGRSAHYPPNSSPAAVLHDELDAAPLGGLVGSGLLLASALKI